MKKSQNTDSQSLDEQIDSFPTPDVATVEKWITDDLGRARAFLQAMHDDPNILKLVARHMHGRLENYKNRPKPEAVNN